MELVAPRDHRVASEGLEQERVGVDVGFGASREHVDVHRYRSFRGVAIRIAPYHGVPKEGVRIRHFLEQVLGVVHVAGFMGAAKGEESAPCIGRVDEAGADHAGVDLLQLLHGVAVLE